VTKAMIGEFYNKFPRWSRILWWDSYEGEWRHGVVVDRDKSHNTVRIHFLLDGEIVESGPFPSRIITCANQKLLILASDNKSRTCFNVIDLGDRTCDRCGDRAQWGAGENNEYMLCIPCAGEWSVYPRVLPERRTKGWKVAWRRQYAEFLKTKPNRVEEKRKV